MYWGLTFAFFLGTLFGIMIMCLLFISKPPDGGEGDGVKVAEKLKMKNGSVLEFVEGPKYKSHDREG